MSVQVTPQRQFVNPPALPIANASMGGLKEEYIKNDTGAILRLPSSFVVQTNISGSGEVIAVA